MTENQISLLIKIAAEMVRGQDMPAEFVEDWKLPKATSQTTKQEIESAAKIARAQCREWAGKIMSVVNEARGREKPQILKGEKCSKCGG